MKPTTEQIAEAANRGIVPGAVCRSPYNTEWTVGDYNGWAGSCDGSFYDNQSATYIYCTAKGWATVITPEPSAMEDRLAAAEASLQRLDDAIAALKAKIEKPVEVPQGLQAGDYCDASKEVADALTAMGFDWYMENFDATDLPCIVWAGDKWSHLSNLMFRSCLLKEFTHLDAPTFLARARVTAKELGLKAPEPWTPRFGDRVMTSEGEGVYWNTVNGVMRVIYEGGLAHFHSIDQLTPINP